MICSPTIQEKNKEKKKKKQEQNTLKRYTEKLH